MQSSPNNLTGIFEPSRIAVLPSGWRSRLVIVEGPGTRNIRDLCLEIHDLVISKAIIGREKDLHFLKEIAKTDWVESPVLLERLIAITLAPELRAQIEGRLRSIFPSKA